MQDELFDIVDEEGRKIGQATRKECHSSPSLIHQVVHVFVFNSRGELFLQKRAETKDIQPGKWDTSVGGHFLPDELPEDAARREVKEELGVDIAEFEFLYSYLWRSPVETELVKTYKVIHDGPFTWPEDEIGDGRFWTMDDISQTLRSGMFTPNLEHELDRLKQEEHKLC